jgi:hypothetical protein
MSYSEDAPPSGLAGSNGVLDWAVQFAWRLLALFRLLLVLLLVLWMGGGAFYVLGRPSYTANAIIGPPNPSPINSLLTAMGTGGLGGGVARKILGGAGGGGGNDPFQEYQQLLMAPQLRNELAEHYNILPLVFSRQWDSKAEQWKPPGIRYAITSVVKPFLHLPVTDHPDVVALSRYWEKSFDVEDTKSVGGSGLSSLTGAGTGYLTVSVTTDNPKTAETVLTRILDAADNIVRRDQLNDVKARIQYINEELRQITNADQREALLQTLASQEEIKVMMVSDKRFAYVLVSRPYASPIPTSPPPPRKAALIVTVAAVSIWILLVFLEGQFLPLRRFLSRFEGRRAKRRAAIYGGVTAEH